MGLQPDARDGPTRFRGLNTLLAELASAAQDILGSNFVGAYLQGSFAVGDASIGSDCDFLIPVHGAISAEQELALRAMHFELPGRRGYWPHHLEGGYPPVAELATLDAAGRSWLGVRHGWRTMEWSDFCNTEVARWSLREFGVTITGPDPRTLVDPIAPGLMRARMRGYAADFAVDLLGWADFEVAWIQQYAVTTLCRIIYTAQTGEVLSKRAALQWAADHLDAHWSALVRQIQPERAPAAAERTRPELAGPALAFVHYAKQWAGNR